MAGEFALRVDIDSRYGLLHGVPNIQDILRRLDLKASFYVVMGGETGIFELLRTRRSGKTNEPFKGVKLPAAEIARMLLLPRNFAEENVELLRSIKAQGHFLGVHGWKHREWTRALDLIDVRDRLGKCVEKYKELFGEAPTGFVGPGFKTDARVLQALDDFGFKYAGDLAGEEAFHPEYKGKRFNHVQVPITLRAANTSPLIEEFSLAGMSDDAVAKETIRHINLQSEKGMASFYCHDIFEGTYKPKVLEEVLRYAKENLECTTMEEIGRKAQKSREVADSEFFKA